MHLSLLHVTVRLLEYIGKVHRSTEYRQIQQSIGKFIVQQSGF